MWVYLSAPPQPRSTSRREIVAGYLLPTLGRMPIDTITPSVVRTWWSRLPADRPTVRARSCALLKAVMNTAVADEVIDSSPCRIRGAANTPRAREIRPATIEELEVRRRDRHTGATMAAWAGATLAELQERLGHSSVNAALRYQHAARGRDQEIAAAFSAMARGSSA